MNIKMVYTEHFAIAAFCHHASAGGENSGPENKLDSLTNNSESLSRRLRAARKTLERESEQ